MQIRIWGGIWGDDTRIPWEPNVTVTVTAPNCLSQTGRTEDRGMYPACLRYGGAQRETGPRPQVRKETATGLCPRTLASGSRVWGMQKLKGALGAVQVILGYRVSPGRELSWAQGVVAESRHAQDRDSQACSFSCGLQPEGACMSAVKLLNLAESGFLL